MILLTEASETFRENEGFHDKANFLKTEIFQADETTIANFCKFVNFYTRHSTDPLATSAVCEQQAETLQITEADATPETIRLLLDTMLNAIDQLEKKWLDEQLRGDDLQLRQRRPISPTRPKPAARKPERKRAPHGLTHWFNPLNLLPQAWSK